MKLKSRNRSSIFDLPVRFGAVPVDKEPLGWQVETRRAEFKVTKFQNAFPTIRLPFQEVQRVEFGHNKEFLAANEKDFKPPRTFPDGREPTVLWVTTFTSCANCRATALTCSTLTRHFSPVVTTMSFSATKRGALLLGHLGRRDARLLGLAKRATL